ncbi:hypothetical protein PT974_03243 [Cladobotryum mycophilum]|uniref:Heterokaryon incompatibility domain-containing protein n=1 Tax=Cladobotryum mycophilum TaxID=491253 RepID=A0ABR0SRR2_9HYPO
MFPVILGITLEALCHPGEVSILDLTPVATPERFRLIDYSQYVNDRVLAIVELPSFPVPQCPYAAISYVWRGNNTDNVTGAARFAVAGAEDGDPIGIDALHHACFAALQHRDDKHQQIRWMFDIYKQCDICTIVALQFQAHQLFPFCHWHAYYLSSRGFRPPVTSSSVTVIEQTTEIGVLMLKAALEKYGTETDMISAVEEHSPAIWRSAFFRTSSRPVDMIFSIMGLFGVTINTKRFGKDDRLTATIALMQEIIRSGGRANWLWTALHLPVNPQLSIIPVFPRTTVQGQVQFDFEGVSSQTLSLNETSSRLAILNTRTAPLLAESMDKEGYSRMCRKACRIYPHDKSPQHVGNPHGEQLFVKAVDGSDWTLFQHPQYLNTHQPKAFAVLLGSYNWFSNEGKWLGGYHLGALLVKEHHDGRCHVVSAFEFSRNQERRVNDWDEHTLWIGGPVGG